MGGGVSAALGGYEYIIPAEVKARVHLVLKSVVGSSSRNTCEDCFCSAYRSNCRSCYILSNVGLISKKSNSVVGGEEGWRDPFTLSRLVILSFEAFRRR